MSSILAVLLVEDNENDALLLELQLRRAGFAPNCSRVETREQMRQALERQAWDVIIADYRMPQFDCLVALAMIKERSLDLPFILVSGHVTEEAAVAAMKAGAHDYVMKDNLARLGPAVRRELGEAQVRRARRQADEDLRRAKDELEMRVQQRTAELKTANQRLHDAISERRRLEQELLEITENERRRIGLDLHDDLGQKLSGIALMTKGLELKLKLHGRPESQDAAQIHQVVQDTMNHASDLAHHLAKLDLEQNDLSTALGELARQVGELFGIPCRFSAPAHVPVLDPGVVTQLCRISQEAVTNAIKHGSAKRVAIVLALRNGQLELAVRNEGKPFPDLRGHKKGMGLRIMNYRASLIGATLEIGPTEQGARVSCKLPLRTLGEAQAAVDSQPGERAR
jgi:signal transduction histidine kinase